MHTHIQQNHKQAIPTTFVMAHYIRKPLNKIAFTTIFPLMMLLPLLPLSTKLVDLCTNNFIH